LHIYPGFGDVIYHTITDEVDPCAQ
jgi:hypothetical protein